MNYSLLIRKNISQLTLSIKFSFNKIFLPYGFYILKKKFKNYSNFAILDIGCGNHAATLAKTHFPNCIYYGVDRDNYNNNEQDFKKMKEFFKLDLTELNFEKIPDNLVDVIYMSHVLEHLPNGISVIKKLLPKLKKNGYLYLEYPGMRSTILPHAPAETLNFFDDNTHIKVYSIKKIQKVLELNNMKLLNSGIRHFIRYIFFFPIRLFLDILIFHHISGGLFWDILGFSEFLLFKKE